MPHDPNTCTPELSDTQAVDAIATILGTQAEWDAETIEHVAALIARVRPTPDLDPHRFAAAFTSHTGRALPPEYDARPTSPRTLLQERVARILPGPRLHAFAADTVARHFRYAHIPALSGPATTNLTISLRTGKRSPATPTPLWEEAINELDATNSAPENHPNKL